MRHLIVIDGAAPAGGNSVICRLTDGAWVLFLAQNTGRSAALAAREELWLLLLRALACTLFGCECSDRRCLFGPVSLASSVPLLPAEGVCVLCRSTLSSTALGAAQRLANLMHRCASPAAAAPDPAAPGPIERLAREDPIWLRHLSHSPFEGHVDVTNDLLRTYLWNSVRRGRGEVPDRPWGSLVDAVNRWAAARLASPWAESLAACGGLLAKIDVLDAFSPKRHQDHCEHSAAVTALMLLLLDATVTAPNGGQESLSSELCRAAEVEPAELLTYATLAALLHDIGYPVAYLVRRALLGAASTREGFPALMQQASGRLVDWLTEMAAGDPGPADDAVVAHGGDGGSQEQTADPGTGEAADAVAGRLAEAIRQLSRASSEAELRQLIQDTLGPWGLDLEMAMGVPWLDRHGVFSAFLVARCLGPHCGDGTQPSPLTDALHAIALHDMPTADLCRRAANLPVGYFGAEREPSEGRLCLYTQPILWLLLLCDNLHLWQRPVWQSPTYSEELDALRICGARWRFGDAGPVLGSGPIGFAMEYSSSQRLAETGWQHAQLDQGLAQVLGMLSHRANPAAFTAMTFRITTPPKP